MIKRVLIFMTGFILVTFSAFAETIELKDGRKIVGEIIHETETELVVSSEYGAGCLKCLPG